VAHEKPGPSSIEWLTVRLYAMPELYAALLDPEPGLVADVRGWIDAAARPGWRDVLDPACGPGGWLLALAGREGRVLGCDLEAAMVEYARERLRGMDGDLRVGDMRDLPFPDASADVGVNLHGSVGHLEDDADVLLHLRSIRRVLRPGGLYILGITVVEPGSGDPGPEVLWSRPATPIPGGGQAAILYESESRIPERRRERIRVLLLTRGVRGAPPVIQESYELLTFPAAALVAMLDEAGFGIEGCRHMLVETRPDLGLVPDAQDVTLVLRRR
jgi:SAM-dependent methyltransferase